MTSGGATPGAVVRVPASSANLGPGFDALGTALSLHFEASFAPGGERSPADDHHPAQRAFASWGGVGVLHLRPGIPAGRGLGFSGAARVAGLLAAATQRHGLGLDLDEVAGEVLARATALEGHADNVAASLYGGVVATAGGYAVRVPLAFDPAVVVWVPGSKTSTDESRARLARQVPFDDAAFNVGRVALLVAALAAGDLAALRAATEDRLHQPTRLAHAPASRAVLAAAVEAGAWCSWLSGSGPSVACFTALDGADGVAQAMREAAAAVLGAPPAGPARPPEAGDIRLLRIDHEGARILGE